MQGSVAIEESATLLRVVDDDGFDFSGRPLFELVHILSAAPLSLSATSFNMVMAGIRAIMMASAMIL
ncbi:hypothetical protein QJS04_geneDACA006667 [Acorus gramineus]|uniref:Uncharacterized protein n=1 Tax=Acorus gramineus TaxID=55184 RepID=A0AAV9AXP4_ACOGR|nr:hypothetical protein QJS04_geneDACA006667 [Acorus gramineus]